MSENEEKVNNTTVIVQQAPSAAMGICALVFSIISIFFLAILFVPLAIIFGIIAIVKKQLAMGISAIIICMISAWLSPSFAGLWLLFGITRLF